MKILHSADIHLQKYKDERWESLHYLLQIGKKEKVKIFIISGDLFDRNLDAQNLRPHIRKIFSGNPFKVVIIPGNHDIQCFKIGMDFGQNAVVLNDIFTPLEYQGVRIWGIPFEPIKGEKLFQKLYIWGKKLNSEYKNILLFHGELLDTFYSRQDFGQEGEERYMPARLSYFHDLNLDYILSGHFHTRFEVKRLNKGGYFVYSGSPVSITQRELGQRKANLLEIGEAPVEYWLDTPHFQKIEVEFDPFKKEDPLQTVEESIKSLHPQAKLILKLSGFINSEQLGLTEKQLREKIEHMVKGRCVSLEPEFRDIRVILEEDLFINFEQKLHNLKLEETEKKHLRDLAIQAMMRTER